MEVWMQGQFEMLADRLKIEKTNRIHLVNARISMEEFQFYYFERFRSAKCNYHKVNNDAHVHVNTVPTNQLGSFVAEI